MGKVERLENALAPLMVWVSILHHVMLVCF